MRAFYCIILFFFVTFFANSQNVGINSTGSNPNNSAALDIDMSDKGVLIPRVALTAINIPAPIAAPEVSLKVYNTATQGVYPNNVYPGFYYWDGSRWVRESDEKDVVRRFASATIDIGDITGDDTTPVPTLLTGGTNVSAVAKIDGAGICDSRALYSVTFTNALPTDNYMVFISLESKLTTNTITGQLNSDNDVRMYPVVLSRTANGFNFILEEIFCNAQDLIVKIVVLEM